MVSVACLLVLAAGGWLWWTHVRQDVTQVFWDMVSNNLSTKGVTHISEQKGQGLNVAQYTQITFNQQPRVHALTVFKQNGSTLATEQISDPKHDFVRYKQISLADKAKSEQLDTKSVLGKWAQLEPGQNAGGPATSGLYKQSLIDILPIANLESDQRAKLIQSMHDQSLFKYDPSEVKKEKVRGRESYLYAVTIKPETYVRIMQQFESMIGTSAYAGVKPADLAKAKPLSVVIAVDARSHTMSQIYDASRQRTERYEGFGVVDTTPLPKASISTIELTQRLGQLLQPQ